jgi:hypothetical protein
VASLLVNQNQRTSKTKRQRLTQTHQMWLPPGRPTKQHPTKHPIKRSTLRPIVRPTKHPTKHPTKRPIVCPIVRPTIQAMRRVSQSPTSPTLCSTEVKILMLSQCQQPQVCLTPHIPGHVHAEWLTHARPLSYALSAKARVCSVAYFSERNTHTTQAGVHSNAFTLIYTHTLPLRDFVLIHQRVIHLIVSLLLGHSNRLASTNQPTNEPTTSFLFSISPSDLTNPTNQCTVNYEVTESFLIHPRALTHGPDEPNQL